MKKWFLLLFIIQNSYCQDTYKAVTIDTYKEVLEDTINNSIYELNVEDLNSLINLSEKKYHLIYSFAYWCKPCLKSMPQLLSMLNTENQIAFYLVNIETDEKRLQKTRTALKEKFNFVKSSFMISNAYGKTSWKKYEQFVEKLVPGHKEYGLSLFILLDQNGNPLYASTYNESTENRLEKIRELAQ